MDFLSVKDKCFVISGVANKKSVAYSAAKILSDNGANLVFTVQSSDHAEKVSKLFPNSKVLIVDVENSKTISAMGEELKGNGLRIAGFLHSMAFANYSEPKPFHQTGWDDFAQAARISCFSLIEMTNALTDLMEEGASVVTVSISNTRATNYGYMGPIKAMLDSTVAFLAKSLSDKKIRVNAVCSGPLKTSASAGIPGYIENYLFAEKLTLRKQALKTDEVGDTIAFLMSPRASGINATGLMVDAGMSCNYFDEEVVGLAHS
tara:strand:- start:4308 stop:5093 length:786 start_codon:yes stop_codon:yes gene_type:complete